MRKSVAISLLLIYIIASSGVAINVHYSSGKLRSINVILDRASENACRDIKSPAANNPNCNTKTIGLCDNSVKAALNCVSVISGGFFQAYDDADTTPVCNTCSAEPINSKCPAHCVSID